MSLTGRDTFSSMRADIPIIWKQNSGAGRIRQTAAEILQKAVSYTHLDVYKRQGFIHTMVGRGSFVADANMEMMKEEKYRKIEEILTEGVRLARSSGISCEELQDIIQMVYEED